MLFSHLSISDVRNLRQVELELDSEVNLFFGENGSGKTSILESVFYLSRSKSFRTSNRVSLINTDSNSLVLNATLVDTASATDSIMLGCSLSSDGLKTIKLNGDVIKKVSHVAELVAVQVITPSCFDGFYSSPKDRRSLIDFGLFHVEQDFAAMWQHYSYMRKQCSVLLSKHESHDNNDCYYWYNELMHSSESIDSKRQSFIDTLLLPELKTLLSELPSSVHFANDQDISIIYKPKRISGYSSRQTSDVAYDDFLNQLQRDIKYKQVGFGANRADINIQIDGHNVTRTLSRGESKLLYLVIQISIITIIFKKSGKKPVILVDDLCSELDGSNLVSVIELLVNTGAQLLITNISSDIAKIFNEYTNSLSLFHVEQGKIITKHME